MKTVIVGWKKQYGILNPGSTSGIQGSFQVPILAQVCENCLGGGEATYKDDSKHPATYTAYPCHLCHPKEFHAAG